MFPPGQPGHWKEHATTDPKQSTETDPSRDVTAAQARRTRALLRRVATHPATYALLPLAVIAVVVAARAEYFVPRYDLAFQELAVQEAARAQRLLGPYSRFGFNHPGPPCLWGKGKRASEKCALCQLQSVLATMAHADDRGIMYRPDVHGYDAAHAG